MRTDLRHAYAAGRSRLRRLLVVCAAAAVGVAVLPAAASAHPLGNFSVNHEAVVGVSADRVDVRYLLDEAEIPTFQQRGLSDAALIARKRAEVDRRLLLTVDDRRVPLRAAGPATLTHPRGRGGLRTTRVELPLVAEVRAPQRVVLHDMTFPGRVGWKAIVARVGRGTAVRSTAPTGDPTNGLRGYPADLLSSPSDVRVARFNVRPGTGTLSAPDGPRASGHASGRGTEDGLTRVFGAAAAGDGVLVLLLVAAFGWGAVHALSPGHGKAMVAAYLVGTRGRPRHAVALGAMVTVTHTAGVFALGAITLALSHYVLPEDLYPWLNLVSGLLVLLVGAGVLRMHLRVRRAARHGHAHGHAHHHHHHAHGGQEHDHPHHHHDHGHSHLPQEPGVGGLIAMGAAAGLIPCPSALVVLLGAIAQGQVALGMLLIVSFSLGLAATLTGLGLAVVLAARFARRVRVPARIVTALPAASAVAIVGVGCVLTANALPAIA